ncbi:tail length tape measure protein [Clostridium botulinum]|nr:tail length tape measure protein [Clostridium botulinum]NFS53497.1 tail length tape measure protein [Clostridium botulinum]NFT16067.1 tail length tape measure protein [Clostridium botulinum]
MVSMETGLMVMDGMVNQPMRQPVIQMQQIQLIQQQISLTNVLQINVQKAADEQDKLNQNVNKSTSSMSALAAKASETFKSFFNTESLKKGIETVIGEASKMQDKMISVQGMLGDKGAGTAYFSHLQKQANESGFSFDELKNNAQSFMGVTKNTENLDKLANLSERLSLGNSGEGISGAGGAINSMLSGDGSDLKDKFGFNSGDIGILQASKDLDDFTSKFDVLLNEKGLNTSMLDEFNNSASSQFENIKENFNSSLGEAGQGALEAFAPVMEIINGMFSNGSFQVFFDLISIGLGVLATTISWICEIVRNNWGIIESILIAIGIYLLGTIIPSVFMLIAQGLAVAATWIIANLPILMFIGAIGLLIYALMQCGITTQQVCGFIGGIFMVMFGYIYNRIVFIWNIFASLSEFVENVFNHPLYSIQRLFYNIWNSIVEFVGSALDWIIEKAKSIPFLKDLIGDFSIGAFKVDIPDPPEDYKTVQRMEYKDLGNEFDSGYTKAGNLLSGAGDKFQNITSKIDNLKNGINLNDIRNQDNDPLGNNSSGISSDMGGGSDALTSAIDNTNLGNNVSEGSEAIKGINDSVEVSNENLELMNDLAELESLQNFITLTPTVQVTTGDIKEEADINTIISRIESYMENEMTNSAEGLYA